MTMITPSYLGDTIEYSSYASNALGALPYGRPAGGREFTSDSNLRISPLTVKYECPQLSLLIITSVLEANKIEPRSYFIIPCCSIQGDKPA